MIHNYRDPTDPNNSPKFRTGQLCVERGCDEPAGTWWSALWCVKHNAERMDRINAKFARIEWFRTEIVDG